MKMLRGRVVHSVGDMKGCGLKSGEMDESDRNFEVSKEDEFFNSWSMK